MSKAPSMPMYWDAYLADTTHLSTEEHGAYLLLLAAMWRRNGWVPDNDRDNARILGLTVGKWRKLKVRLAEFLTFENGHITQKKLLNIWDKTQEKIETNRANGSLGGRAKGSKNKTIENANGSVSVNPNGTIPEPQPEPSISPSGDITPVSPSSGEREVHGSELPLDAQAPLPKSPTKPPKADAPPPKVRLPDGWVPSDEDREYALNQNLTDPEIEEIAYDFRVYWQDRRDAQARRTERGWQQAWRNRCRQVAAQYIRNRSLVQSPLTSGFGQGGGIAGAVARRQARAARGLD